MGPPEVTTRQLLDVLVVLLLPKSNFPKAPLTSAPGIKLLNSIIRQQEQESQAGCTLMRQGPQAKFSQELTISR